MSYVHCSISSTGGRGGRDVRLYCVKSKVRVQIHLMFNLITEYHTRQSCISMCTYDPYGNCQSIRYVPVSSFCN